MQKFALDIKSGEGSEGGVGEKCGLEAIKSKPELQFSNSNPNTNANVGEYYKNRITRK